MSRPGENIGFPKRSEEKRLPLWTLKELCQKLGVEIKQMCAYLRNTKLPKPEIQFRHSGHTTSSHYEPNAFIAWYEADKLEREK